MAGYEMKLPLLPEDAWESTVKAVKNWLCGDPLYFDWRQFSPITVSTISFYLNWLGDIIHLVVRAALGMGDKGAWNSAIES